MDNYLPARTLAFGFERDLVFLSATRLRSGVFWTALAPTIFAARVRLGGALFRVVAMKLLPISPDCFCQRLGQKRSPVVRVVSDILD